MGRIQDGFCFVPVTSFFRKSLGEDMKVSIVRLTPADLDAVDGLMKRYGKTLGFLPRGALQSYLEQEKGGVLGAKTDAEQLVGYLLYSANPSYFRITHLCVLEKYQGQGIAKQLVNDLKNSATTQRSIKLNCRRDFPANTLWPELGFVALGEKPSRSRDGHFLTIWQLTLAPVNQLELFQAKHHLRLLISSLMPTSSLILMNRTLTKRCLLKHCSLIF
ncbi:MAG: GNAT family N-acetyltransferase [Candidatus Poribacteria bacterium]|nr:GNAT family N-acetyltransferase [Candidatus Poribacteria bacterium]